ncbi:hypothetical protein MKX03_029492, partial [Papaver bracteatum]
TSDGGVGEGKKPKIRRVRKPSVIKSNLSILDFDFADVTPLTTIQTSDTTSSVAPIQTYVSPTPTIQSFDPNTFVSFQEIFPDEEIVANQGLKGTPIINSANLMVISKTSPPLINIDSQPKDIDANQTSSSPTSTDPQKKDVDANISIPSPFVSVSPSSSSLSLLSSLSLNKKTLNSVNLASHTLLDIINSAQSSTDDPCKLRIFYALSKILCEFPSDIATRDEIHSQIDPSFHTALDVL